MFYLPFMSLYRIIRLRALSRGRLSVLLIEHRRTPVRGRFFTLLREPFFRLRRAVCGQVLPLRTLRGERRLSLEIREITAEVALQTVAHAAHESRIGA